MSQRKTTAPPTPKHSRSSLSSRKGLIATEKTKKQSAKKRPALDNRFHRTLCRRSAALNPLRRYLLLLDRRQLIEHEPPAAVLVDPDVKAAELIRHLASA